MLKKLAKFLAIATLAFGLMASPAEAQNTNFYSFINGATAAGNLVGTELLAMTKGGSQTFNATTQSVINYFMGFAGYGVLNWAPYNASGFIVQTSTSGTVASGTTNIPVVSSAGFNAGQTAIFSLAGTSCTKNFAQTIASIPDGTHITVGTTALTGAALPPTATSSTTGTQCTSTASGYIVYSIGSTLTTGSVALNGTSIPVGSSAGYLANQGVLITGGGVSGANLITTVASIPDSTHIVISGSGITNASGITSGVNVQHDDTVAFQATFNKVNINTNFTALAQDGFYQINGPASGTENAALHVPSLPYYPGCCGGSTVWNAGSTLTLMGFAAPGQSQSYIATSQIPPMGGVIVHVDNTGSTYSVIGGTWTSSGLNNVSNVKFIARNITFRNYPNPWVTMVNCKYLESCQGYSVSIDTGETALTTQPTHSSQFGWVSPFGQNGGNNELWDFEVYGQYNGSYINEHTILHHIRFDADFIPMFTGGTTNNNYGFTGDDVQCNGTPYCIYKSGSDSQPVFFGLLNIEHTNNAPSWANVVADIYDPNNSLFGFIGIDSASFETSYPWVVTGATNLHWSSDRVCAAFPLPCDTFANLSARPNGFYEYCSDCTVGSTCAGSGTGAFAKRLAGAWVCN